MWGKLLEVRSHFGEPSQYVFVEPDDLRDDGTGIFSIFGQAFHHRTEERLRQSGGTVESFLNRQFTGPFCSLNLSPQFVEQHTHPTPASSKRIR